MSDPRGALADAAAREAALDPRRSFIVQAPAGSGKTELLIRRYAGLLAEVDKPEEILAITFTRKAAAEMKKRVLARLGADSPLAHRIRIQTIDAFCASLTRQMPVVARFGAQPVNVQDEDARALYREAARRTLDALGPEVERLLAHLDNDMAAAGGLLAEMLARRDQWLHRTGLAPTRGELEAALVAERERLLAAARSLLPEASPELAQAYLTKDRGWRKRPKPAPAELVGNEPLRLALSALLDLPPARYSDAQWEALSAMLALLPVAAARLVGLFAERGQADFAHVAQGAVLALGDPDAPTDLLLAMDTRIRHVLVDEFQDTSVSQWALLERLTAGWEPGDGRTLFAVGDPMQSVYRFRDAEVGLFLQARREGLQNVALQSLVLATNFRSQAGIVDWVNGCFDRVLPPQDDEATGAVRYAPSVAHHPSLPGEAVRWHGFFERADEAARVVELCRAAGEGGTAILVRNRTHLDAIVPALQAAGIRFRAVDIDPLGEKPVVQDLHALTRAISHPGDRVAWLAILRAPWCGLPLEALARHFEGNDDLVWERMQSIPGLERMNAVLGHALAQRLRGTLRDCVEGAWLALGGPACVADATGLEDAEAYLDELERLEQAGAVEDFAVLEQSLERLYARPDAGAGPDAVQIMTIHKAKGLEFGTVIVPGLDRPPRASPKPLFAWKSVAEGRLLLAPIDETGAGKDPIYAWVRALEREAEDLEAGRLFYVAATRAVSRLHLLGCAKVDEDGTLRDPPKRSLLAKAWFAAAAAFDPAQARPGTGGAVPHPSGDVIHRLPAGFPLPAAPAAVAWAPPPEGRAAEVQIEFSWASETARHVGTVVHRWLQRIGDDALQGWNAARIEQLRPAFARELERRGVPAGERDEAAQRVAQALANAIGDERGRWILGPHAEARNELRLRGATAAGVQGLVMDRVFTTATGERWIVDYKTSRQEGSGVEAFLDRERERYREQLARYAALLPGTRTGLYFPALKAWREVD